MRAHARRSDPPGVLAASVTVGVVTVVAALAVALFDLRGEGPLSDEWMYQWSAVQLAAGHLRIWPELSPLSLVQGAVAAVAFRLGAPLAIARLTELPFLILGAVTIAATAVRLGASRIWAAVVGASVALSPVLLFTATGLLSDAAYFGLLGVTMLLSVRYLQSGRGLALVVATAVVAGLQRQFGVEVLVALGLILASRREDRRLAAGLLLAVVGMGLGTVLLVLPPALHISGGRIGELAGGVTPSRVWLPLVGLVFELGPLLGLVALPLALRLALSGAPGHPSRLELLPSALGVVAVVAGLFYSVHSGGTIFPGPILNPQGLGALDRISYAGKASPYPAWFFGGFMILVTASTLAALVRCSRAWVSWDARGCRPFLLLLAALQTAPLVIVGTGDRYFLPVIMAVAPWLALMASGGTPRWSRISLGWAVCGLALLFAVYAIGESDFIAWHNARHELAVAVYPRFSALEPNLGEDGAFTYAIPVFEETGRLAVTDQHPELLLAFASAEDPRPGVIYGPWPRGKVVAVCLRNVQSCEARLLQARLH